MNFGGGGRKEGERDREFAGMGATDSKLLTSQTSLETVTTVLDKDGASDPCLSKLEALHITPPLLNPPLAADVSLKDMLLRRSSSLSPTRDYGALDPSTTVKLHQLYEEWQRSSAARIGKTQEELGNKIEGVEALEVKLLQRLNVATSVIKSTAAHLEDVHPLKQEVAQMKRNLHATIQSYNALCAKIEEFGPASLKNVPRQVISHQPLSDSKEPPHTYLQPSTSLSS